MLHIVDGESVAGSLRQAGISGEVAIYGDLMYEGPAPGLDDGAWVETRARFMADAGYAGLDEARRSMQACNDALASALRNEESVIWLDHRLSDQLILIRALDWFSRQDLGAAKLSLICIGTFAGQGSFCWVMRAYRESISVASRHAAAHRRGGVANDGSGLDCIYHARSHGNRAIVGNRYLRVAVPCVRAATSQGSFDHRSRPRGDCGPRRSHPTERDRPMARRRPSQRPEGRLALGWDAPACYPVSQRSEPKK